jgi:hypothetical protein
MKCAPRARVLRDPQDRLVAKPVLPDLNVIVGACDENNCRPLRRKPVLKALQARPDAPDHS